MRTWWRKFKKRFLDDELFFRRLVRAGIVAVGAGAATLADQLVTVGAAPGAVKWIKVAGFVALFLGMLIRNGEKNTDPAKLAEQIDAAKAQGASAP